MRLMKNHRLIDIQWPEFGSPPRPAGPTAAEFGVRLANTRAAMRERGHTHLVVFGDREHFSNLHYLCGIDPRFEEAILIVRPDETPLLLVGNECEGYLGVSPLHGSGGLRHELYQSLSLLSQPRDSSRKLADVFRSEGIDRNAAVGCVGFKYFPEHDDADHSIEIPAYIVDTLRELSGHQSVTNATDLLMHPTRGLRATVTPTEIAYMEYAGALASQGMKNMLHHVAPGMLDYELARHFDYNGEPLCCHITMVSRANRDLGLSGPVGARLERGDPLASNFGYWGSNICRAGWIAETAADLPPAARDYIDAFAGRYFAVMNEWFSLMRIGTPGGRVFALIAENLPFDTFHIGLNPGHLIHTDEWLSSPIYPGSEELIRSGMAMQVDVIPNSPKWFSTRMEDGIIIADNALQAELRAEHPDCHARCLKRREFMINVLGLNVPDEVLPTSNIPAIVPPFFLQPNRIFALER